MKKIALACLAVSVLGLTGCANAINTSRFGDIERKTSTEGLKYKVFYIENCKFIGTQDNDSAWSLAGPIGKCE